MSSVTVRIPEETHRELRQIAEARHETVGAVISELVAGYKRDRFWDAYEQSAIAARNDPGLWAQMQDEQAVFDGALNDGLE